MLAIPPSSATASARKSESIFDRNDAQMKSDRASFARPDGRTALEVLVLQ
jgi:hypothetical protein